MPYREGAALVENKVWTLESHWPGHNFSWELATSQVVVPTCVTWGNTLNLLEPQFPELLREVEGAGGRNNVHQTRMKKNRA